MTEFSRAYTEAALNDACRRISDCPTGHGKRNETLNREIYSVARLIGSTLQATEIKSAALSAAESNGYLKAHGMAATAAVVDAAIAKGQANPRTASLNRYEERKLALRPDFEASTRFTTAEAKLEMKSRNQDGARHSESESALVTAAPAGLPGRTPPDTTGKPFFVKGDENGPPRQTDEVRRHVYRRGGEAVRVKVKRSHGGFVNWYKVTADGSIGWQAKEPQGFVSLPYVGPVDPFDAELRDDVVFWPEGEKDVDGLVKADLLAFTLGGCGDGLPERATADLRAKLAGRRQVVVLADNDEPGRIHAEKKAALIQQIVASVKILHFPELPEKGDVSDWLEAGGNADALHRLVDDATEWLPPAESETSAIRGTAQPDNQPKRVELVTVCMVDVKLKPIDWLWKGRVALGKTTVLAGDGGLGKSTVLCDIAARTTTGEVWPDGERNGVKGNVIILAAEDALDDTLGPRLKAAQADLHKVFSIASVREIDQSLRSFSIKVDLLRLEEKIKDIGEVRLIIIDPITSYLGAVDSHKNAEVRSVLEPLSEMASRYNVALICNNHFNKGSGSANSRIIGSVAFVTQARSAFIVTSDADDPDRRLFMPSKTNIGVMGAGMAYRIGGRQIDADGIEILTSQINWESEPVTMTADDALAALDGSSNSDARSALGAAEDWLEGVLGDTAVDQKEIKKAAEGSGLSWATVRRARQSIGATARKEGFGQEGRWVWEIPAKVLNGSKGAHDPDVSTLGDLEHLSASRFMEGGSA